MKLFSWRMVLTSLTLCLATAGIAGVLPEIEDVPKIEHNTAGAEDFGAIVNPAHAPINEVIRFDPVIEMPPENATLEQLEIAYRQKLDSRQYPDAVTIARRMVDRSITGHGVDSIETAYALSDLGAALHHAGDNAEAGGGARRAHVLHDQVGGDRAGEVFDFEAVALHRRQDVDVEGVIDLVNHVGGGDGGGQIDQGRRTGAIGDANEAAADAITAVKQVE